MKELSEQIKCLRDGSLKLLDYAPVTSKDGTDYNLCLIGGTDVNGDGYYAFNTVVGLNDVYGTPINQCGSLSEVIKTLKHRTEAPYYSKSEQAACEQFAKVLEEVKDNIALQTPDFQTNRDFVMDPDTGELGRVVDEWSLGEDDYVLWEPMESVGYYMAEINYDKVGHDIIEYDHKPTRDEIKNDHLIKSMESAVKEAGIKENDSLQITVSQNNEKYSILADELISKLPDSPGESFKLETGRDPLGRPQSLELKATDIQCLQNSRNEVIYETEEHKKATEEMLKTRAAEVERERDDDDDLPLN